MNGMLPTPVVCDALFQHNGNHSLHVHAADGDFHCSWRIPTMHVALPLMDTTIHVSAALLAWRLPAMYATLQLMETTIHASAAIP